MAAFQYDSADRTRQEDPTVKYEKKAWWFGTFIQSGFESCGNSDCLGILLVEQVVLRQLL